MRVKFVNANGSAAIELNKVVENILRDNPSSNIVNVQILNEFVIAIWYE